MLEVGALIQQAEMPLVTIRTRDNIGQVLQLPGAAAFSVYGAHLQTEEVQERYDKFVAPAPATLALRAAGLHRRAIHEVLDITGSLYEDRIDKAYEDMKLDHGLFAARAVTVAFERGFFKPLPDTNPIVFKPLQLQALRLTLKYGVQPAHRQLLAEAAELGGSTDLAVLTAQAYASEMWKPQKPDADIKHLIDVTTARPSILRPDNKRAMHLTLGELVRVQRLGLRVPRKAKAERAAERIPPPVFVDDMVYWGKAVFRVDTNLIQPTPTSKELNTMILNIFDMSPKDMETTIGGKRAAHGGTLVRARRRLKLPDKAEERAREFFERGWITVLQPAPIPEEWPGLESGVRNMIQELATGDLDEVIAERLNVLPYIVTQAAGILYDTFKVKSRQGIVTAAYGAGLLEPATSSATQSADRIKTTLSV